MKSLNHITLTEILDVYTVPSHKDRRCNVVNRFAYGLSFCESGKIIYTHNDRMFVSDQAHALILPQGQSYSLYGEEAGYFPLINFRCTPSFNTDEFLVCRLSNPESYLKDYEKIRHLMLFPQNHARVMSILYDMFSRLAAESNKERDILASAFDYLEEHYTDPNLNNTILAEQAHISEVYFRRLFRERYGVTPGQYISDIRISKAKQLLTDANLSVTAIAEASGFSTVYHFCRAFKSITGQTPTEYQKQTAKSGL